MEYSGGRQRTRNHPVSQHPGPGLRGFDWQHLAYQFNTSPLYNTGFQEYRTMHNAASVSYRNMITAKAAYEADPRATRPVSESACSTTWLISCDILQPGR